MVSPFLQLEQDEYSENPSNQIKSPFSSPFEELENEEINNESGLKSAARWGLQIPQGILEGTQGGIATGLWQFLGAGEVNDPEELDRIKAISEREGVPFDEESFQEAGNKALGTVPTVSNIANKIEEKTGIPLSPSTRGQKALRFGSMASKISPKDFTFRGANTSLPKPILGAGVTASKEALQEAGVPEPFAEIASFGVLKPTSGNASKLSFTKEKPSGLPERGFEKITESTEIPKKKLIQINDKLESDFKDISDKIIKESPIGETAENLRNDPRFKNDSRELLNQAQVIADETPGNVPTETYKKELQNISSKQMKGFSFNEYKKSYQKFIKEAIDEKLPENMSKGQLVEQYRENNKSLGEYFEPGSSKALNRAKKEVLLDQNRAIANVIKKESPELFEVFDNGNKRWTKIMDAEAVDTFVSDMFPEGKKVDFKHMKELFDDPNYQRIFKRSLGEEGAKAFEQAVEDMLTSEKPYKMLREAESKGFDDMIKTGIGYVIHPNIGYAKAAVDATKGIYRSLINMTLDKPQIGLTFTKAIKDLKSGDFKASAKEFSKLQEEINPKKVEATKEAVKHFKENKSNP